ncbi:MAG: sigma-70 family RNA polymerase sigma factor [Coriobacteriia bacterium]|nr:sigma-70 family RNA polymerase sigma factor [Coriobacteriia bacterium]
MTEKKLTRLIARAKKGDSIAFGRLYDEYANRVYAFVRSRTSSAHDAEDVTATVFLKVWESLGSYDNNGVPFSAWLFRIARNAAVDEYRRGERRPIPTDGAPDDTVWADSAEVLAVARADAEMLRSAVRLLTEEQASVIALRYWWDLSIKETAESLGKNENAVKQLQHRAVKSLARILQEDSSYGNA